MNEKKESVHVTMHVLSRKTAQELNTDKTIYRKVDVALNELMQPVKSGGQLAKRLSLPANVPIQWNVRIAALDQGFKSLEGHIPVMVSVGGLPSIMEKLRPDVVEEVINMVFSELRKEADQSKDLAQTLGYVTDKPHKFHLYMPHQVKLRLPTHPGLQGDGGDGGGDGWGKGCSSWPW